MATRFQKKCQTKAQEGVERADLVVTLGQNEDLSFTLRLDMRM
ncbi:MAG: hypothetical protein NVSMB14_05880 [Isosphaeraceae bacterium]